MKPITVFGIVLIIAGIFALVSQGITYTKNEKVLDIGPVEATRHTQKTIPLPPIVGGASIAAGVALVFAGNRGR